MDISVRSETFTVEDQSWLGSAHGTDATESITLDLALFVAATHYPNGYVPSGLCLGKVTATGLYGPYGASPSEVQTITVDATGGTFTITFDGETTAAIPEASTAAAVQTALELLSNINAGDVTVTGAAGGPFILTFGGQYLGANVPAVTTNAALLTGGTATAVVATTVAGGGAVADGRETFAGHLFTSQRVGAAGASSTTDVGAPLLTHGKVREANLPTNHGLDAAAKADAVGRIRYI